MGCWNETCAVTHLPIFYNEPVVMIILTNNGVNRNWWNGSYYELANSLQEIHEGHYNDYGWIQEIKTSEDERLDFRSIFIHKKVWNDIMSSPYKEDKAYQLYFKHLNNNEATKKYESEIICLCNYANSLRLNLNAGIAFKGCQQSDFNKYIDHLEIVKKQIEISQSSNG